MALVFHPATPVQPGIPVRRYVDETDPLRSGYYANPQTGLRIFMHYDETAQEWSAVAVDADHPRPEPRFGSVSTEYTARTYAGRPVYAAAISSTVNRVLFYSITHGAWVVASELREPRAWKDSQDVWHGDGWYQVGGFDPTVPHADLAGEPRGTLTGGSNIAVSVRWPRWVWDEDASAAPGGSWSWSPPAGELRYPCGVWKSEDGAQPERLTVGCLRFRDGGGQYWVQSSDGESFSCSGRGLTLSYNPAAEAWVTQNVFSQTETWYRSLAKPSRLAGATLEPRKLADGEEVSDTAASSIALTFLDFVPGGLTEPLFYAEVALWR